MIKHLKQLVSSTVSAPEQSLLDTFIQTEQKLHVLPDLSPDEKVSLEQEIAISHLYHSSKIEGTALNDRRLAKAIHA